MMIIRELNTSSRSDRKHFIQFPFDLYRSSTQWVPPIAGDVDFVLNRKKHPFYEHSDAAFLMAEENGRILGRVAVLDNRRYNDYQNQKTAFFYLFECVDNETAALELMAAAESWASRRGLNRIIGPLGFLQGDAIGLLVEGFEHRPAIGIAYNHAYYDRLLKEAGYRKLTDYFSGTLPGDHQLPERFYDIAGKVKAKRGFTIKSFSSKKELKNWVPRIQEVYNRAFTENFEFSPLSEKEALVVADRLMSIGVPQLIKLVMKGEEIIGFLFAFPDISRAIQKIKGRLWPFGFIHLLREFKRTKWVNFNGTGLLPGHRGVGANAVLYTEMARTVRSFRFAYADIVQVEEDNVKSLGDMKAIGVEWYKKHRVYQKRLNPARK